MTRAYPRIQVAVALLLVLGCGGGSGGSTGPHPAPARRLAFVTHRTGNDDIFLVRLDGSDSVNLTRSPGKDEEPSWSPDGSAIAFLSDRTGHFEVWVMDTLGAHQSQVTNSAGEKGRPSWTADGQRILYSAGGALLTIKPDGSGVDSLTPAESDLEAAWSPAGGHIAFSRGGHIWVSDTDGASPVQRTFGDHSVEGEPAWSPDGQRLAFYEYASPSDSYYVNVIGVNGSGEYSVTAALGSMGVESGVEPSWSPDGTTIAFSCDVPPVQNGTEFDLCLVHPDGSHFLNLTRSEAPEHWPAWAP